MIGKNQNQNKNTQNIDLAVLCLLQSIVVKKLETQRPRETEGMPSGRKGCSPHVSGGAHEWNSHNLPTIFGSNQHIFCCRLSTKAAAGRSPRGVGWGESVSVKGTPLHAGAQWAKLRKASGHRYTSELWQGFKRSIPLAGSPFRMCGRLLPSHPKPPPKRPCPSWCVCVPPPVCQGTCDSRASSLTETLGRRNLRRIRLRVLEKFRVGREGWESPLQALGGSGASSPAASSLCLPPFPTRPS